MVSEPGKPLRIVLTGPPGCGKTTAVRKIVDAIGASRVAGFYTQEIRESGRRVGFQWHRLDGPSGILAHVDIKSRHRVGKYGVDIESFDTEAVPILDPGAAGIELFVVDEIGKMECLSEKFVEAIRRLLASQASLLATVARKGGGLIRDVKSDPRIQLLHLTAANRNDVTQEVVSLFAAQR